MLVMEMSNKKQQIPAIRFNGFTDAWEQRKLMETNTSFTDGNYGESYPSGNDMSDSRNGVPFLRGSNLKNGKLDNSGANYITLEKHKELTSGHLVYDDIVIAVRGSLGALGYVDIDNVDWNINSQLAIIRTDKSELNGAFVIQFLSSNKGQKELLSRQTGTALKQLPIKQLQDVPVPKPELAEQNKISEFFRQLDDTIALHQRMSDKQKKLKANLLQMMFPRNGEKIPEVRLAGFAEDWSQRTLEDISDKVTEKNKAREFTETLTNSAEYGIISQSDYFDKDISNINNIDGYYVVRPDDFVYNPRISNFAPVGPIKRNNLNRIGIMSPLYYVFRPKGVDHTFLEKYFETSYWHIFMKMNGDSGARADRFAIKDAILKEMPIPYPVKEEQVRIGIFFNQLDKSIVLHQEKIAHLKVLKSTLLNKMFI